MIWMTGFSAALFVYLLVLCVILLFSFIILRRKIRKLAEKEQEMGGSLQEKIQVLDKKTRDLEKLNKEFLSAQSMMKAAKHELESQGTEDGLTRLASLSFFNKILKMEWRRAFRFKRPLSLVLMDIDYYKPFIDAYGNHEADQCLRKLAVIIKRSVSRAGDLAARLDGSQFAVILPETTTEGALTVAERIRKRVEALALPHKFSPSDPFLTVSCGVTGMTPQTYHGDSLLLEKVKEALIRAQNEGHNCVKL